MTLIEVSIITLLVFILLIMLGRAFIEIYFYFSKKRYKTIFDIDIVYFFPLIGLYFIGNLVFLLNYFSPVNNNFTYLILLLILLGNFINKEKLKMKIEYLIFVSFTPLVFSFYNNNVSDDALMYHFGNQKFILNEKIVFGISNLFPNYGFNSLFEYISAIFWVDDTYMYIHMINLLFISAFYYLIFGFYKSNNYLLKNISILTLIISFLDNFGFNGGRNGYIFIQEIGKFDASFGIVFFLSFLFILLISNKEETNKIEVYFLLNLLLFLSQLRPTGILLFIPASLILLIKFKKNYFKYIFKNYIFASISFLWIVKNLINTACLVYPVSFTCIKILPWHFPNQAKLLSIGVTANNRNPNTGYEAYSSFNWINDYWISYNYDYIYNFLITSALLLILTYSRKRGSNKLNLNELIMIISSVTFLILWFIYYPNYRFSVGFFLSLYVSLLYKNIKLEKQIFKKIYLNNLIFFVLLSISLALVVRVDSYFYAIDNLNLDLEDKYTIPYQSYEKRENSYGYKPSSNYCFDNITCSTSGQEVSLDNYFGYKVFIPKNIEYNTNKLEKVLINN